MKHYTTNTLLRPKLYFGKWKHMTRKIIGNNHGKLKLCSYFLENSFETDIQFTIYATKLLTKYTTSRLKVGQTILFLFSNVFPVKSVDVGNRVECLLRFPTTNAIRRNSNITRYRRSLSRVIRWIGRWKFDQKKEISRDRPKRIVLYRRSVFYCATSYAPHTPNYYLPVLASNSYGIIRPHAESS